MSSSSAKKAIGAESEEDTSNSVVEDSNSVSSKPEEDNMPRGAKKKGSDTSTSTTHDPSSTSATATVATVVTGQPTSQSSELPSFAAATAAAAPPVPLREKKPRKAGFRAQFLQKLRVMLDRESHNDSTIVQWSTDGNSFIISDQTQFEADIIPTYFDKSIVFASFLSKLYRWGFSRLSSRETGHYEFRSPTFRRLGADSAPAAATAVLPSNAGGGASIQVQQQQQASSLLQFMAQINQPPALNPLSSQAEAIADLISSISVPSQQSVLNQNSNQPNNTDATGILQSIVGSNQQPLLSPHSTPSQQPVPNHANQLSNGDANNHLQPFQQWSHPNPTLNLLNAAPGILAGSQAPSAELMGYSSTSSQSNAMHALMSLYGMMLPQPTLPNTNTSAPVSRLLVLLMHRVVEEELQRRVQADAIHEAIIATIGQIVGGNNMIDEAERQRRLVAALGQTLGSTRETNTSNLPLSNPTGMSVRVPYNTAAHSQQVGAPPSPGGNLDIQASSIAAILQAAAAGQVEENALAQNNGPDNSVDEAGKDEGKVDGPLSPRKRKSPDKDEYDEGGDDSWADDHRWNERLRPRKKSPRK